MFSNLGFLSSPEFIISTAIGLVGILVAVLIFFLQRNKKIITYELVSDVPLVSIGDSFSDKLKISFNGDVLDEPHILTIRLRNTGNQPLIPRDVIKPIEFDFDCVKVFSAGLLSPLNRAIKFTIQANFLILEDFLLNSGDTITFKVIVSDFKGGIRVLSEIAGVNKVKKYSKRAEPRTIVFRLLILLVSAILLSMVFGLINNSSSLFIYLLILVLLIDLGNFVEVVSSLVRSLFQRETLP